MAASATCDRAVAGLATLLPRWLHADADSLWSDAASALASRRRARMRSSNCSASCTATTFIAGDAAGNAGLLDLRHRAPTGWAKREPAMEPA